MMSEGSVGISGLKYGLPLLARAPDILRNLHDHFIMQCIVTPQQEISACLSTACLLIDRVVTSLIGL